jgi:hypothetical protein
MSERLDNKLGTDAIYLDFANAFDTVPHNRLKLKLRNAGIRGNVLRWIVSFLNNRRQKVVLPGGSSSWMNVTSGVPQGSILGPILFLLYVNDLPDSVNSTAKLFADDTKRYFLRCKISKTSSNKTNTLICFLNYMRNMTIRV